MIHSVMPTVATFNGIKIEFYFDEHPPPHFRARYAEFIAQIDMEETQFRMGAACLRLGELSG